MGVNGQARRAVTPCGCGSRSVVLISGGRGAGFGVIPGCTASPTCFRGVHERTPGATITRRPSLARRRLKAAPDDVEALRLLARSTARGSVETGRRMRCSPGWAPKACVPKTFSCWVRGSCGRAGCRKPRPSGRRLVASRARSCRSPRAARRCAAGIQNRLIEAAGLAERLARQPGFELARRAEPGLASSAELGDPRPRRALLHRALLRPEAARLDPASRAADIASCLHERCWKPNSPQRHAAPLDEVLKAGSDQQASWLLMPRACKKEPTQEADAALEAAGTYRGRRIRSSGSRAAMLARTDARNAITTSSRLTGPAGIPRLCCEQTGLRLFRSPREMLPIPIMQPSSIGSAKMAAGSNFRPTDADRVHRTVLAYAFGSPDHYVSFVGSDDQGRPSIIRLSRYQSGQESGWVRTTGHSAGTRRSRRPR